MKQPVVLAYNGDFEATVAIRWLAETLDAEVITVTLDLGQQRDPAEARDRALAAGAVRAHVLDARDEFARDCILPALQSTAFDESPAQDPIALASPLIARKLVEIAMAEHAVTVAHAARSTSIDDAVAALAPELRIVAPARLWHMTAGELIAWSRSHGVPPLAAPDGTCRIEDNLWGRLVSWVSTADGAAPPSQVARLATPAASAADEAAVVAITFEGGLPVAVNGVPMPLAELIESVSVIAAPQGLGRIERIDTDAAGAVTRTVYDAPAPVVLHAAYASRRGETTTVRLKLCGGRQTVLSELMGQA